MSKATRQLRLYPTAEQSHLLMAHCQEYISTVNVLAAAFDADLLPAKVSTKDFRAVLPSAVKNQALRDARAVFKRSLQLDCLPVLKKPICQWNQQNWRMEAGLLILPVSLAGKTQQVRIPCANVPLEGKPGILRIKKKRGKWIADISLNVADAHSSDGQAVMGIDLGIKVPAVVYVGGKGTRFFGNGRYQRVMRRQFYARRKQLQKALPEFEKVGERGAAHAAQLRFELEFCERYLPKGMDEAALRTLVRERLDALKIADAKQVGRLVGDVMKTHKGQVDAADVKRVAEEMLKV